MKKTLVILAPGFEEVEAITAIDFLRRADIEVLTLGLGGTEVTGSHHITVKADVRIEDYHGGIADAVIVPGGQPGSRNIAESEHAGKLIIDHFRQGAVVAAICAAPAVVLEPLGILRGKRFTTFPGTEDQVKSGHFTTDRCVVDGNLITSRAAGSAAEFTEAIISVLMGKEKARELHERTMQKN